MLVRIQLLPKGVMLHFMDGRSQHWKHESFSIVRDRESGPIRLLRGGFPRKLWKFRIWVLRRFWSRKGCPGKDGGLPGNRNQFLFLRRLFSFQESSTGSSTPKSLESQGGWSNGFLFHWKNNWEKWPSLSFFRIGKHAQPRKGTGLWKRSCFP